MRVITVIILLFCALRLVQRMTIVSKSRHFHRRGASYDNDMTESMWRRQTTPRITAIVIDRRCNLSTRSRLSTSGPIIQEPCDNFDMTEPDLSSVRVRVAKGRSDEQSVDSFPWIATSGKPPVRVCRFLNGNRVTDGDV